MASTKTALKAAKAALDAQEYDKAIQEAQKVIDADSKNYHANVFIGLALDKKEQNEESEKAYRRATAAKPQDALAWQGLLTLYEKQGNKKLDQYADAVRSLAQIYADAEDQHKCQTVVDKYMAFAKQHGTRMQLRHAYDLQVPGSPVYDCLEGRLPKPDLTYMRIAELIEIEEKETVKKLIAERRTRIGAKVSQVTLEVKREVYATSDLEGLYQGIIDFTHDDELRRQYEEKLLQRVYDVLSVLPNQNKEAKREQVWRLAEGMAIIKVPSELAWRIFLEWRDVESMREWDVAALRQYVELLPEDGLGKVLRGFLRSEISPFPKNEDRKDQKKKKDSAKDEGGEDDQDGISLDADNRLYLMTEGLEESSRSAMSQRIMAEYYLHLEEYASAVEAARKAVELISQERRLTGLALQNKRDGANIALGTSLVHYQTPRHHKEARKIFEEILARKSENVSALIGIGLILEEEEDFSAAADFLSQALKKNPTTKIRSEAAWCRALTGDYAGALEELEECLKTLEEGGGEEENKKLKAEVLYRIGYCMWHVEPERSARKDRKGAYARFLQCLQLDLNCAPAYTGLGIFYADYARDRKRARKCFQKAFELSPSEVYAAERLARSFADMADWDLVEAVSQRVVDSGKVRPPPGSKRKPIGWPYAALGICHLNNQEHSKAIPCFNAALRIDPTNYHCLVGLGESYHGSGRFIAATRAFEEALKHGSEKAKTEAKPTSKDAATTTTNINSNEGEAESLWFAKYMLSNVHRDLGSYDAAIRGFTDVLTHERPGEYGVSIALLQTYVESAWHDNALGLFGRAAESAVRAVRLAWDIASTSTSTTTSTTEGSGSGSKNIASSTSPSTTTKGNTEGNTEENTEGKVKASENITSFNLWKSLGEACSLFAGLGPYVKEMPGDVLREILSLGLEDDGEDGAEMGEQMYGHLRDVDHVTLRSFLNLKISNNDKGDGIDHTDGNTDGDGSEEEGQATDPSSTVKPALLAAILCQKRGISVCSHDMHAQAVSWYNLGWAEYQTHTHLVDTAANNNDGGGAAAVRASRYLRAAVRSFKRAIELEARNAEFWNALGIVTTLLNARVAQHAFVRSLYLNERSPVFWTNIATLYLLQNDIHLARDAFVRAQSADPGYAHAWVGIGILALLEGKVDKARASFTQAFEIGDSSSRISKHLYATSMFDHVLLRSGAFEISDLLQPLFALYQLRTQEPGSQVARHLLALYAERIGNYDDSIDTLRQISADVEAEYERTESHSSLLRFAQAQSDLARASLAAGDLDAAIEHATTSLDLSEEEEGGGGGGAVDPETRNKHRLSAHLTAGLAHHRLGQNDESISMFRAALAESSSNPDVVCLLCQVLWAKGSAKERDVAREQLFENVEKHPEHAQSIVLLSVIALLDGDKDTVEAITGDLHALRARADLDDRSLLKISSLLEVFSRMQPQVVSSDPKIAEQAEAATSIMVTPWKPHGWTQLAGVADDEPFPAEMALITATAAAPPGGNLDVEDLSRAHAGTNKPAGAQRAIMLTPWLAQGWSALADTTQTLA